MFGLLRGLKDRDIADNCGNTPRDIIHKYYAKYINIDMIGDSFTDLPEKPSQPLYTPHFPCNDTVSVSR